MITRFEFYPDAEDQIRWRAVAKENGLTIGDSGQGYADQVDAVRGLQRILRALSTGAEFVILEPQPIDYDALAEGIQPDEDEGGTGE